MVDPLDERLVDALGLSPQAAMCLRQTLPCEDRAWVPPWAAAELARAAGATGWRALGAALACIYAAAHLADDLADRDATVSEWSSGTLTVVELPACGLQGIAGLDVAPEVVCVAQNTLSQAIRELVQGQRRDLAQRNRADVDPTEAAYLKAGASVAAFFEVAALVAGVDARRWAAAGRALGVLGQVVSDLRDLLVGGLGAGDPGRSGPLLRHER